MSEPVLCAICSRAEDNHNLAHHKFSKDGELIPNYEPKKSEPRPKTLVAIPDPALRALLIEKGIITYEELSAKEVQILGRQQVPTTPSVDG